MSGGGTLDVASGSAGPSAAPSAGPSAGAGAGPSGAPSAGSTVGQAAGAESTAGLRPRPLVIFSQSSSLLALYNLNQLYAVYC